MKNCAVIWCEDHRKLAYFSQNPSPSAADMLFGVGDLVEFEIREENDLRLALAPVVVAERHHSLLSDELLRSVAPEVARSVPPNTDPARVETSLPMAREDTSRVLPFPGRSRMGGDVATLPKRSDRKYG
ncbi:MAG: hypothetical protein AAF382_03875 [Pseudomonadota bacterium]